MGILIKISSFSIELNCLQVSNQSFSYYLMKKNYLPSRNTITTYSNVYMVFFTDEQGFNEIKEIEEYFLHYEFVIIETTMYLTSENIESEEENEDEEITIIKTYKEDKCIVCLENKPDILYENCKQSVKKLKI